MGSRRRTCASPAARPRTASAPWTTPRSTRSPAQLSSYGIAGQGFDDIEVDYTRRIRLLSFVDASFYSNFMERSGKRYADLHRRPAVVFRTISRA